MGDSNTEPETAEAKTEGGDSRARARAAALAAAPAPQPGLEDVRAWEGYRVDEIGGHSVARIEGLFVDQETGDPAWVLAKLGRFGKVVPISVRECAAAAGRVWVPHDREVIRNAPAVDPTMPLNREQEQQVLSYYGIPDTVGRGAEIKDRPATAVTAQAPV
ncbi:MAG: hypothetical protein M3Y45_10420 [Actinomycetota bacterium]|nr:hypothetical protein [Actinomycetota bacterium]